MKRTNEQTSRDVRFEKPMKGQFQHQNDLSMLFNSLLLLSTQATVKSKVIITMSSSSESSPQTK